MAGEVTPPPEGFTQSRLSCAPRGGSGSAASGTNAMTGVAMAAEAQRAVLASVGEDLFRWCLVEFDELGEQDGARPDPAALELTPAVPKGAYRIAEN